MIGAGVAVYYLARRDRGAQQAPEWRRDEAVDILKRRYAAGEIGREEYEQKLRDLAG